jgi:hypothetical protein
MFYKQHILVIDEKYSSDDGLSTTVKMAGVSDISGKEGGGVKCEGMG